MKEKFKCIIKYEVTTTNINNENSKEKMTESDAKNYLYQLIFVEKNVKEIKITKINEEIKK